MFGITRRKLARMIAREPATRAASPPPDEGPTDEDMVTVLIPPRHVAVRPRSKAIDVEWDLGGSFPVPRSYAEALSLALRSALQR